MVSAQQGCCDEVISTLTPPTKQPFAVVEEAILVNRPTLKKKNQNFCNRTGHPTKTILSNPSSRVQPSVVKQHSYML